MSTLAYGILTTRRDQSPSGTSTTSGPPGVTTFVDALAALIPAEVLVAHAAIVPAATTTELNAKGNAVTTITAPGTLRFVFWALILVSAGLYALARYGYWDHLDWIRILIPPLAFVGWTMLQKATAFDAVAPNLGAAPRLAVAVVGAVVLGAIATRLAYRADQKPSPQVSTSNRGASS